MVLPSQHAEILQAINTFCAVFGVPYERLMSSERSEEVVECRFAICRYLSAEMGIKVPVISGVLNRDRAAIKRGIIMCGSWIKTQRPYGNLYGAACSALRGESPEIPAPTLVQRIADLERRIKDLEQASTNN